MSFSLQNKNIPKNQFFQNYVFLDELRVSTAVAVVDIQEIIFKVCCHR